MPRSLFLGLAAAAGLTGCFSSAPVVKTEAVHIVCPEDPPPEFTDPLPQDRPNDMRIVFDDWYRVKGELRGFGIEYDAYRKSRESCSPG